MLERWRKRKAKAIARLGGKCVRCNCGADLQFDHIDPRTKSFDVSKNWGVKEERFWAEVDKCQLLCRDCHKIKNREDVISGKAKRGITHGKHWAAYHHQCQCNLCQEYRVENNEDSYEGALFPKLKNS